METIDSKQLKTIVKETYTQVAEQTREQNASGCCGTSCGCSTTNVNMAEDYAGLPGYVADADLGLGCGLPTAFAHISQGDTVIDLGSGAGNDAFVARSIVGESGKVIGIDMTEKMIEKARLNAEKLKYNNVEFRLGDIENIPMNNDVADVVVSNCVLNLVPDKVRAFNETFRILKPGGHFSVSDIVLKGDLPENIRQAAEMYAGCVSGAIQKDHYIEIIQKAGFTNVSVQKERPIHIPKEILLQYISEQEIESLKQQDVAILSITVYGEKP